MMGRLLAFSAASLLAVGSASAHRLDEYAQLAAISVARDVVTLDLRLTPGLLVSAAILAVIDPDGDRVISPDEQKIYVNTLLRDLSLSIDGETSDLRLVTSWFPSGQEILGGVGVIALTFETSIPYGDNHVLLLEHNHRDEETIYLVNALQPRDEAIKILSQHRSPLQDTYDLEWAIAK